jgi:predicted phage terminase large subunit-like protein
LHPNYQQINQALQGITSDDILAELGRRNVQDFFPLVAPFGLLPDKTVPWHIEFICKRLTHFYNSPDVKKLMIFVPPQHFKSTISSQVFPAWVLGKNPNTKIALASYSPTLSSGFNRKTQHIIDSEEYQSVFPKTKLNSKNVSTDARQGKLRNSEIFEIIGGSGFFKTVGVGQALTGTSVDLGIIDDPYKDRADANSQTIRNRVWDWYTDVFKTRMHNHSKQLMLFTRWHEDDLAGRLLLSEPNEWEVIKFPALREDMDDQNDPREIGEALLEHWHSREKIEDVRVKSPRTFSSLYQQRPSPQEGEMIKRSWFGMLDKLDRTGLRFDVWIDGAFTDKTKNDPTAIMITAKMEHDLIIIHCEQIWMELWELVESINALMEAHRLPDDTLIHVEKKASGHGIKVLLSRKGLNVTFINDKQVQKGKVTRVEECAPYCHGGRVKILKGGWNESFFQEVITFPNGKHDDQVDVLAYAVIESMGKREREFFVLD